MAWGQAWGFSWGYSWGDSQAAGSYGKKKKYIVEKQGKLLVYSSADAAINAVEDKPVVVQLAEVKKLVGKKQTSVIKKTQDLSALWAAYEAAIDEQDIEDLLMLI